MSINTLINKYKNIALSDRDLINLVDGKANIIIYDQLYKYNNIDEVLEPYGAAFILYLFRPSYGHWIALIKRGDIIEYADSYGDPPDEVLKFIQKEFRKKTHQDYPYLSRLLWESPYKIEYNHYRLQSHKKNVRSCGRWAALRVFFKHLTLNQFAKIFNRHNSDDLATLFTMYDQIE